MFEKAFRIWIANKRLIVGEIAVCPNGHRQRNVTHLQRSGAPSTMVCYECFMDWIVSNVPGVEIQTTEEKGNKENAD